MFAVPPYYKVMKANINCASGAAVDTCTRRRVYTLSNSPFTLSLDEGLQPRVLFNEFVDSLLKSIDLRFLFRQHFPEKNLDIRKLWLMFCNQFWFRVTRLLS